MKLASKLLEQIENSIIIDNGAKFKELEKKYLPKMNDAYKSDRGFRDHLGASVIGDECLRKIWYKFHNVQLQKLDARMIRLFNRGHLEEARFISMLECAGVAVEFITDNNKQFGYSFGYFGGSIDGIGYNIPDLPNEKVMLEFKTMSEKRFKQFSELGVEFVDQVYYNQLQCNMYCMNTQNKTDFKHSLFICVNKNNDDISIEIVDYNEQIGKSMYERAIDIVNSKSIPLPIKSSKAMYPCKLCEYKEYCFDNKEYENKSCMNCELCSFDCLSKTKKCDFDFKQFSEDCYVKFVRE